MVMATQTVPLSPPYGNRSLVLCTLVRQKSHQSHQSHQTAIPSSPIETATHATEGYQRRS
jgi:hypothetical protein